jgi:hypothetical protein
MAINPKNFNPTQLIQKMLFRGRPNIMADVDLNRQGDLLRFNLDTDNNLIGATSPVVITGSASYDGSGNLTYNLTVPATTWTIRGCTFSTASTNIAGTLAGAHKSLFIYLMAQQKLVTFADDQTMSGINSPDFATPLAAADNEVYFTPIIVARAYPDVTIATLEANVGGGNKVISLVGGVIPLAISGGFVARLATYTAVGVGSELKGSSFYNGNKFNGSSFPEIISHIIGVIKGILGTSDKIGMCTFYSGPLTGVWDTVSGLGISGGWQGWAIMDTRNGTEDAVGKSFIGLDTSYTPFDTIGNTGGEKDHILIEQELPHITIHSNTNPTSSGTRWPFQVGPGYNTTPEVAESFGSDLPHNNMHPYVVLLPVQKIS